MAVRLDLNGLLATAVGADGLAAEEVAELEPQLARVREELAARRAAGTLAFADLPHRREDVRRVLEAAAEARAQFDTLVVLGIGGSALGIRAVTNALGSGSGGLRVAGRAQRAGRRGRVRASSMARREDSGGGTSPETPPGRRSP